MPSAVSVSERRVTVQKTARVAMVGKSGEATEEVWFACHGYGQLAGSFIRDLSVLDDGSRLIVAPEALSRFYLDPPHQDVGASWMTREERLEEIDDYLAYLDSVHEGVFSSLDERSTKVVVLGFSQGAQTAARWACRGTVRANRLVLWGELFPPELEDEESLQRLRSFRTTVVAGTRDQFCTGEKLADQRKRLSGLGIPFEELSFKGGHRLDDATLLRIAKSPL